MGNKQTAVERLIEEIGEFFPKSFDKFFSDEIQQAKSMEKEQIEKAYNKGIDHQLNRYISPNSKKYYNETYGKDS